MLEQSVGLKALETEMRGLSLWEPWASAIACRHKMKETRPWDTQYRGEIAICSTAKLTAAMSEFGNRLWRGVLGVDPPAWTTGCAVAVVTVYETELTEEFTRRIGIHRIRRPDSHRANRQIDGELSFGNYDPGRYVWHFRDVRPLREPYPIKGRQRLWRVKPKDQVAIRALMLPVAT